MPPALATSTPASSPVVLIADGAPHARRLIRGFLARGGHRCIYEAETGAEAVALMGEVGPGLLILDWDIAPIGAEQILALAGHGSPQARRPILLTMSRPVRSSVQQAVELGITSVLAKPFSLRALRLRLDPLLRPPEAGAGGPGV